MKNSFIPVSVVLIVLLVSLVSIWFIPSLQDFMVGNQTWNGMRGITEQLGARTVYSLDETADITDRSVMISIPYLEYNDAELQYLKDFVLAGNTLLLADDYGYGNDLLIYLGVTVRFSGKPLLDPLFSYKNRWFPTISDFSRNVVAEDVKLVVLNHATALLGDNMDAIAWSSSESYLDLNGDGVLNGTDPKGPFPVAGWLSYGAGKIILVSDPSILTNSMMRLYDNQNFVKDLTSLGGEGTGTLIDASHLTKTSLDLNKSRLTNLRSMLATPYPLLVILVIVFVMAAKSLFNSGGFIEKQQ